MDFFLAAGAATAAFIALWQGVSAHGGLLNVPWFRFFRRAELVGGLPAIAVNAVWLVSWVAAVTVSSMAITYILLLLRPAFALTASKLGIPVANTPGASLYLIAVGASLYFTLGTAHTCTKLVRSPPEKLLEVAGPNPEMGPQLALAYWRTQGPAKLAAFILTTVLVPFYRYFLDRRGILESGCTRLLLHEFGNPLILSYCDSVCKIDTSDSELGKHLATSSLDDVGAPVVSDHLRAYGVCTILVRRHGFGGARSRLIQAGARPPRGVERSKVGMRAQVDLGGVQWPCIVQDVSRDGSGLCVLISNNSDRWGHLGNWIRPGVRAALIVSGKRFELEVARHQYGTGEITIGLRAPGVRAYRRELLNSLRPQSLADA